MQLLRSETGHIKPVLQCSGAHGHVCTCRHPMTLTLMYQAALDAGTSFSQRLSNISSLRVNTGTYREGALDNIHWNSPQLLVLYTQVQGHDNG